MYCDLSPIFFGKFSAKLNKQRLKRDYRLSTEQQQSYMVSYSLAVATNVKYIGIEFSNQPVVIPLHEEFDANYDSVSIEGKDEIIPIKTKALIEFKLASASMERNNTTSEELQRLSSGRSRPDRWSMNTNTNDDSGDCIYLQDSRYVSNHLLSIN